MDWPKITEADVCPEVWPHGSVGPSQMPGVTNARLDASLGSSIALLKKPELCILDVFNAEVLRQETIQIMFKDKMTLKKPL
jgi:hypothetical protein